MINKNELRSVLRLFLIFFFISTFVGCGKYSNPEPPERLSPGAVTIETVTPAQGGISVTFLSPTNDVRGKKLNELSGYKLYRKEIEKVSDSINPDIPFVVVQDINDKTIEKLKQKKSDAIDKGTPVRRVSLSGDERRITVADSSLVQGKTYIYKLVPYIWDSVDGGYDTLIKITYTGSNSVISLIPSVDLEGVSNDSINVDDTDSFMNSTF